MSRCYVAAVVALGSDLVFARYRAHEATGEGWMYLVLDQRDGKVLATRFQADDGSP